MTIYASVKRGSVMASSLVRDASRRLEQRKPTSRCGGSEIIAGKELGSCYAVTRTARRQAAQKTMKKHARNTGKLAVADQFSTARLMKYARASPITTKTT